VVAAVDSTGRAAYLNPINKALKSGIGAGYSAFLEQKALSSNADSPSFFLYSAQAFRTAGADPSLCLKMVTNVLETSLCNAQTCRVVAYFLCSIGLMDTAVTAFENVAVLAPEEPQSQTDLAFARFFRLREKVGKPRASVGGGGGLDDPKRSEALSELHAIVSLLTFVVTKTDIPNRFREIEWPVLILLSWVCDWGEWRLGKEALAAEKVSLWPEAELPASKYRLAAKLDVFIWLGWDVRATSPFSLCLRKCSFADLKVQRSDGSDGHRFARPRAHGRGGQLQSQPFRFHGGFCQPRLHARIRAGVLRPAFRARGRVQGSD